MMERETLEIEEMKDKTEVVRIIKMRNLIEITKKEKEIERTAEVMAIVIEMWREETGIDLGMTIDITIKDIRKVITDQGVDLVTEIIEGIWIEETIIEDLMIEVVEVVGEVVVEEVVVEEVVVVEVEVVVGVEVVRKR